MIKRRKSSKTQRYQQQSKVALKILSKERYESDKVSTQSLINEILAHWVLEQCEGVLKIMAIYDNEDFIVLVLEYQSEGSLM
jgi:hypothetical protein